MSRLWPRVGPALCRAGRLGGVVAAVFVLASPALAGEPAVTASPTKAEAPVVAAPAGTMRGGRAGEASVFRGIPYARPPVGALRWRPTEALPRWDGVREATRFGAACPQPASPFYTHAAVSEDCLFLNVWAPAKAEKAPVLFWIHGGSLVSGAGSDENYDGAAFAAKGVVVVTINYRLGALGWLAHPGLSAEAGTRTSGNYGLMDQVEALRWVRRNIAAFGGDPDNVTIAGESAGALSVLYLMADPEARGLFGRAIAESAYLITMPELRDGSFTDWPDAETAGVALAEKLGAHDVADLRAMSAEAIVEGTARTGYFPLGTVDGRLLPRQLIDVFDRDEQARVPILAGFNEGEIRSLRFLLPPAPADAAGYEREIRARYGDLADAFLERYPAATLDESMLETTRDALYGWTAERLVRSQTEVGAPSFLYYFDHGYPAADQGGYRAFHASEIPYVFGNTQATPPHWPVVPNTAGERRLSEAMLSYWATFVKAGVPVAGKEAAWQPYHGTRTYMAFEDQPRLREGPPNAFGLHEAVVCRRRAHGGMAWHWNVGVISPPLPGRAEGCG